MCAGKHVSLEICVRGNNELRETRIPATPVTIYTYVYSYTRLTQKISSVIITAGFYVRNQCTRWRHSVEIYPVTGESRCASSLISNFNYSFRWRMPDDFHVRKIPESVRCLNLHIPMVLTCYLNCLFNKAVCSYVSEGKDISL